MAAILIIFLALLPLVAFFGSSRVEFLLVDWRTYGQKRGICQSLSLKKGEIYFIALELGTGIDVKRRVMRLLFLAFIFLGPSSFVFAQNNAVSTIVAPKAASKNNFSPQIRFWNDSFISSDYEATSAKDFGFIGASLTTPTESSWLTKMEIDTAFAFNSPFLSYLNFKDLYLDFPFGEMTSESSVRLQLGRKRSDWSQADQRWNLGIWEPVFKWNPLNPERQGLTGLFILIPFENLELELMGSPVYLPNQGPSFQVTEEGEFKRGNPWFRPPAQSVQIWSQTSKVEYNLNRPNESSVVMQRSYATRLRVKTESFFIQGSYAVKPMNELPLGYDGLLDIARDRGLVEIITSVQYHELTGADVEWRSKYLNFGISSLRDKPTGKAEFPDENKWTRPIYKEAIVTSPYIDINFLNGWNVNLQYISITGGEMAEEGPLAEANRASITRRFPFSQAQGLEVKYQGRLGLRRPWQSSLNYTVSTKNQFDLIQWRGLIQITKGWNIFCETLLVRSQTLTRENQNEFAQFENHDRLLAGVGYVF